MTEIEIKVKELEDRIDALRATNIKFNEQTDDQSTLANRITDIKNQVDMLSPLNSGVFHVDTLNTMTNIEYDIINTQMNLNPGEAVSGVSNNIAQNLRIISNYVEEGITKLIVDGTMLSYNSPGTLKLGTYVMEFRLRVNQNTIDNILSVTVNDDIWEINWPGPIPENGDVPAIPGMKINDFVTIYHKFEHNSANKNIQVYINKINTDGIEMTLDYIRIRPYTPVL